MHKFFLGKLGADHKELNEVISSESLLFESKFVFFAVGSNGPEGGAGSGSDDEDGNPQQQGDPETTQQLENSENQSEANEAQALSSVETSSMAQIVNLREHFSSRYMNVLDTIEHNLPVDIDPTLVPNARDDILKVKSEIDNMNMVIENDVKAFVGSNNLADDDSPRRINAILYREIPKYTVEDLKEQTGRAKDRITRKNLVKKIHVKFGDKIDVNTINKFVVNVLPKLCNIAENEFMMIKRLEEVKKVAWDIDNALQKKEIRARKIKLAEQYLGFPLKKGQELECVGLRRAINPETGTEEFRDFPEKWRIRDVNVGTIRRRNPEDPNNPEAMIAGVWVSLENRRGEVERLSPSRMKRFVDADDLKPVVCSKEQIINNVPHLQDMGFEIKEGMTLEYDIFQTDNEGILIPMTQEVKVLSLNNDKVTLDREIIYRLQGSSPDLVKDDKKSTLTLGEFSKWLNQKNVIPQMSVDEFYNAVYRHYEYMNKKYKSRRENCHSPITIKEGAVLYSNSPDMPLYRIENIAEDGMIKLTNKKQMSFVQFIKWIYANDIEPYTPELEKNRSKEYLGFSKRKAVKVEDDTKEIIKYFETHPDKYRKTREAWLASLNGKESDPQKVAVKEDYYNVADKASCSGNFLSDFWNGTEFLRIADFVEIFKVSLEMYKRNYGLKQKFRYAGAAVGLPYFGPEFKRIQTQAENEGTDYYKGIMESYSTWEVEDILYSTTNPSEMLASLFILSESGMLRFDDPRLWEALNKINPSDYQIPILQPGADPYIPFGPGERKFAGKSVEGLTGMDLFEIAINNFFGDGMYLTLKRNNDGGISEGQSKAATKGAELESDPRNSGGLGKELERLLASHMSGEFVDPTEFEGLLWYAFEGAGIGADARIYFLLMALFAKNSRGRPLLGWERLGAFITKFGPSNFPVMDFFKGGDRRDLETGELIEGRAIVRADLEPVVSKWIASARNTKNFGPSGKRVNEFFFQEVLTSRPFQNRLEKVIGEGSAIDHEDAPFFIPALKDSAIEDVTGNIGGSRKKFSIAGYKNTYLGFGLRIHSLVDKIKKEQNYASRDGRDKFLKDYKAKLADTFRSFVRYDGIMDSRYLAGKGSALQRLGDNDMADGCVYDPGTPLREYQEEMHNLLYGIINAYERSGKINVDDANNMKRALSEKPKSTDNKAIAALDGVFKNFGANFDKMIKQDNGALMFEAVQGHGQFKAEKILDISSDDMKANAKNMEDSTTSADIPSSDGLSDGIAA